MNAQRLLLVEPPVAGVTGKRILVVEDDGEVAGMLVAALEREGYAVSVATTATAALQRIERCGLPHIALVDIRLPGVSGLEFCRIVQRTSDLPVILLTGVDDAGVKAEAIRAYAEDYIVKPFHLAELLARIERVLRRMGGIAGDATAGRDTVPLGRQLSVSFAERSLCCAGVCIDLTPTESKLLHVLMAHEGAVVTLRYLGQRIWPGHAAVDETLRAHISRLRRKLAQLDPEFEYLRTERNLGYTFLRPPA